MTNTFGMMVLLATTAGSPLMARKAKPTNGRNVTPNPTPKPIASPFLSCPSALILPSNVIVCPSTAVVERHLTVTAPALPQPLALVLSTCSITGVPRLIRMLPSLDFTSFSTIAVGLLLFLLVACDISLTDKAVPLSKGPDANTHRLVVNKAITMAILFLNIMIEGCVPSSRQDVIK